MFEYFNFARKRRLSYDQLQTLQLVAQQVVLSLESSVKIPGAAKKAVALKIVRELLQELDIVALDSLIDIAIEVAAKLLKTLDIQSIPLQSRTNPVASLKLDVSGRPASGNSERTAS